MAEVWSNHIKELFKLLLSHACVELLALVLWEELQKSLGFVLYMQNLGMEEREERDIDS